MTIREVPAREIDRALFSHYIRRQVVGKCLRKVRGEWVTVDDPFVDDWTEEDYHDRAARMKSTGEAGGVLLGAFVDGRMKGFASLEPTLFGSRREYIDLSRIHVSEDARGQGVGRALFEQAKRWAREHGARKLYISAHSAVETQAFYRAVGCAEAKEYDPAHVAKEPCDCQMECALYDKTEE